MYTYHLLIFKSRISTSNERRQLRLRQVTLLAGLRTGLKEKLQRRRRIKRVETCQTIKKEQKRQEEQKETPPIRIIRVRGWLKGRNGFYVRGIGFGRQWWGGWLWLRSIIGILWGEEKVLGAVC